MPTQLGLRRKIFGKRKGSCIGLASKGRTLVHHVLGSHWGRLGHPKISDFVTPTQVFLITSQLIEAEEEKGQGVPPLGRVGNIGSTEHPARVSRVTSEGRKARERRFPGNYCHRLPGGGGRFRLLPVTERKSMPSALVHFRSLLSLPESDCGSGRSSRAWPAASSYAWVLVISWSGATITQF